MAGTFKVNEQLATIFAKQPCWMIEPLATELNYSIPSVRRFLAAIGYYSSFTHNGRWYTLRSIPNFNRDGLWFHHEIGFSRTGSLTKTLISLTANSPAGITAEQLGKKLHCRCHTVLVQLCRKKKLQRQKIGRSFIYLATDFRTAARQRQALSVDSSQLEELPAEIAILILVEFIRNPEAGFAQLATTIKRGAKVTIEVTQIERLFQRYSLKKTMLTAEQPPGEH
jgi:hypothetical protein